MSKYHTDGTPVAVPLISGLSKPAAIAVSGTTLYLTNNTQNSLGSATIDVYGTDGSLVQAGLVTGLSDPYGIAVSGTYLYVTDVQLGGAVKFDTAGHTVISSFAAGYTDPIGIAVSGSHVYIADAARAIIDEYDTDGHALHTPLHRSHGNSDYIYLAVSGSNLFATDQSSDNVSEFNLDGTVVADPVLTGLVGAGPIAVGQASQVSGSAPAIASFSVLGPNTPGATLTFEASSSSGVSVKAQASTDDSTWIDLPAGSMTENAAIYPGAGNYSVTTTDYPLASAVYFRAIASNGAGSGTSGESGPFDLQAGFSFSVSGSRFARRPAAILLGALSGLRLQYHRDLRHAGPGPDLHHACGGGELDRSHRRRRHDRGPE